MTPDLFTYAAETARDQAHVRKLGKAGFYQTTPLTAAEKIRAVGKANAQERVVLHLLQTHGPMSPSEMWEAWPGDTLNRPLLTSIRRATTSLTDKGLLRKTAKMVKGSYHMKEHQWEAV